MRKSKILIICLVCLLVFLIPEENIPNIQIGIIQPHNYELEEEVELTTPQHGSFVQTTKVLSDISNLRKINQIIKLGTFYIHTGVVSNNVKVYRSEDLVTWTDELTIAIANSEIATILGTDGTDSYLVFIKNDGSHYNLCWCKTVNNGDTWTNGSGGAHGTYNEAGIGVTGYDIGDESVILSVFKIGAGWFTLLWEETSGDTFIIDLSDFSTVYTETMDSIGAGCILSTDSNFYFPVVINGETAGKLLKFDGSSVTTHSTIDSDATKFSTDDPSDLFDDLICCERNEILYVFSRVIGVGVVTYYVFQYISSWKELLSNFTSSSSLPLYYTVDVTDRDIRYFIIVDDDGYNLVYSIKENGNIYLIYNEIYDSGTTITQVSLYPYVRKNGSFPYLFEWGPTALSDVSDCKIKKDGLAEFNDYSPTTRFVEKQYVELYNNSNELVYQGFVTKIDRIDLIQKLIHLKSLANYDLEKQLSDSYTTKTYYEMIETSIDTHALYLTYSLDHTPVTTYTMEHKKTLAELIKWGTKQESLKDYVTPATVLTIDVGTTDTGIDVSDADGDVIDEYKSYEITYNPSIVILYGGFVNGVRLVSTWRSTVIGDQPFSDNYPEVVDQTQLDNLAEAIGTGKDFKILVFEFTVFNKAYIQPGQQIDFQYTLDQTNYPVLASKAKYYVISNEINLSQDSQFIRIADALIDEAKGDQKNGLTVENAFQLVEQVQGNVNTLETDADSTYLKKTGVETQNLLLKDNEATSFDIKEGANSYLKFVTTNGGEKIVSGKTLDMGSNAISGITTLIMNNQLTNSLAIGTKPLVITSTTKCDNLNADKVDGADLETTWTDSDTKIPSSKAMNAKVTSRLSIHKNIYSFTIECQDKDNPVTVTYSDGSTYVRVSNYFHELGQQLKTVMGSTPPTGMTRRFWIIINCMDNIGGGGSHTYVKYWDGTNTLFDSNTWGEQSGSTEWKFFNTYGPYDWTTYNTVMTANGGYVTVCVKASGKSFYYYGTTIMVEDYYA